MCQSTEKPRWARNPIIMPINGLSVTNQHAIEAMPLFTWRFEKSSEFGMQIVGDVS
jgi:hypothetical protein